MTAGPIVRYKDMKEQMKKRRVNALQLGYGARRFILGLAKKVLLADTLASLYGEISAGAGNISVLTAWIGMFALPWKSILIFQDIPIWPLESAECWDLR